MCAGIRGCLQESLRADAECALAACRSLLGLVQEGGQWLRQRLAGHSQLAYALDTLLEEDAYVQVGGVVQAGDNGVILQHQSAVFLL